MTKSEDINYSPGKIIILWRLIFFISQNEGVRIQEILGAINETGIMGGTIPVDAALRLADYCRFLNIKNEMVYLTDKTRNELLPLCPSAYPNFEIIRFIIKRILSLSVYKFSWLLFFDTDVELFKTSIPDGWIEVLESAGLFDFEDESVFEWWNSVVDFVNEFDVSNRKEIGDVGEYLTMDYEIKRLQSDNIANGRYLLRWMSKFSDQYGYDISSIRGKLLKNRKSLLDRIQIDAKSSVVDSVESFRFKVSRNEYRVAMVNIDTYFFYCWIKVDVVAKTAKGPYVVPAKILKPYFPQDRDEICEWSECKFKIDLNKHSIS